MAEAGQDPVWLVVAGATVDDAALGQPVEAAAVPPCPADEAADSVWSAAPHCDVADAGWYSMPELAAGDSCTGKAALVQLLQHRCQSWRWQLQKPGNGFIKVAKVHCTSHHINDLTCPQRCVECCNHALSSEGNRFG